MTTNNTCIFVWKSWPRTMGSTLTPPHMTFLGRVHLFLALHGLCFLCFSVRLFVFFSFLPHSLAGFYLHPTSISIHSSFSWISVCLSHASCVCVSVFVVVCSVVCVSLTHLHLISTFVFLSLRAHWCYLWPSRFDLVLPFCFYVFASVCLFWFIFVFLLASTGLLSCWSMFLSSVLHVWSTVFLLLIFDIAHLCYHLSISRLLFSVYVYACVFLQLFSFSSHLCMFSVVVFLGGFQFYRSVCFIPACFSSHYTWIRLYFASISICGSGRWEMEVERGLICVCICSSIFLWLHASAHLHVCSSFSVPSSLSFCLFVTCRLWSLPLLDLLSRPVFYRSTLAIHLPQPSAASPHLSLHHHLPYGTSLIQPTWASNCSLLC